MKKFNSHVFEFVSNAARWGGGGFYVIPSVAASSYFDTVKTDNPRRYYRLGDKATSERILDYGLDALDGTAYGSITYDQPGLNNSNDGDGCMLFDGVSAYVDAARTEYSSDITIEAIVQRDSNPATNEVIWEQYNTASNRGILLLVNVSGQLRLDGRDTSSYKAHETSATITDNIAHHVLAVVRSNAVELYIDGVNASADGSDFVSDTFIATDMAIGANKQPATSSDLEFEGYIDEVAIYSSALSSARIAAHANAALEDSLASTIVNYNPLFYYPFQEVSAGSGTQNYVSSEYISSLFIGTYTLREPSGRIAPMDSGLRVPDASWGGHIIHHTSTMVVSATESLTIGACFTDFNSGETDDLRLIAKEWDGSQESPYGLRIQAVGTPAFITYASQTGAFESSAGGGNMNLADGQQHVVIGVFDHAAQQNRVYADGFLEAEVSSSTPYQNTRAITNGYKGNLGSSPSAVVDEPFLCKTALTHAQVADISRAALNESPLYEQICIDDPEFYFRFQETSAGASAVNIRGTGNGTYTGSTTFDASAMFSNPKRARSLIWNATGSAYVQLASSGMANPGTGNFTLACIVSTFTSTTNDTLLDTRAVGGAGILIGTKSGVTAFYIGDSGTSRETAGSFIADGKPKFLHFVCNRDTDKVTLFVNASIANTSSISAVTGSLNTIDIPRIGHRVFTGSSFSHWLGGISEFAYYATALATSRVQSQYDAAFVSTNWDFAEYIKSKRPDFYWQIAEGTTTVSAIEEMQGANGEYKNTPRVQSSGLVSNVFRNTAVHFNGVSEYLSTQAQGYTGAVNLKTIELWVHASSTGGVNNEYFLGWGIAAVGQRFTCLLGRTGKPRMAFNTYVKNFTRASSIYGENHHVVFAIATAARASACRCWIDGSALTASSVTDGALNVGSDRIDIARESTTNDPMRARIAHVAIYDRLLTSTEVEEHFVAGTTGLSKHD